MFHIHSNIHISSVSHTRCLTSLIRIIMYSIRYVSHTQQYTHKQCLTYTVSHMSYTWRVVMHSQSHLGWHFRKLFQSSKLKARTSLFTGMWQTRRSSFEPWALKQHSKMSPQVGSAVHGMSWRTWRFMRYFCIRVFYALAFPFHPRFFSLSCL